MPVPQPPIIVKRYGGVRLYDAAQGRCVSRAELHDWMGQGTSVIVVDSKTGADVTESVTD